MRMFARRWPLVLVAAVLGAGGATAGVTLAGGTCVPPGGGRCEHAESLPASQGLPGSRDVERVRLTPDGRTITVLTMCGGRLRVSEGRRVVLTYIASAVPAGAMSCAWVPLTVTLRHPLAGRPLIDGVTHARVTTVTCAASGQGVLRDYRCR